MKILRDFGVKNLSEFIPKKSNKNYEAYRILFTADNNSTMGN